MRHSFMLDNFLTIDLIDLHVPFCMFFTPAASVSDVCDSAQVTSLLCSTPVPLLIYFGEKNLTGGSVSESFCTVQGIVQQILNSEALILSCSRQHKETLRRMPMSLLYGNIFFCYQFVWVVQGSWRRSTS